MLAGSLSIRQLPLEQYPDIAPPRVKISAPPTPGPRPRPWKTRSRRSSNSSSKAGQPDLHVGSTSTFGGQRAAHA
ncbi:MAG: hypothetical protein LKM38_09360 [Pseudomonas veronii]|nr:hypothetical protein [Pseudomonas veronii]